MDLSLIKEGWAQLGAMGLLLLFGWYVLRTKTKECAAEKAQYLVDIKAERDRNQALTDKVIAIADSSARTAAELTAAVKGIHP